MENTKLVQDLQKQISFFDVKNNFSHIVILCVGTNKLVGDAIGPLVGQNLIKKIKKKNIVVYGNMMETLNLRNAKAVIKNILDNYKNPFIITVDSALGKHEMLEKIIVYNGNIEIGASLGHSICYYSHINIKAVVGEYKNSLRENMNILKNANIHCIYNMSNQITDSIYEALDLI